MAATGNSQPTSGLGLRMLSKYDRLFGSRLLLFDSLILDPSTTTGINRFPLTLRPQNSVFHTK
jgi:hypothetical protein